MPQTTPENLVSRSSLRRVVGAIVTRWQISARIKRHRIGLAFGGSISGLAITAHYIERSGRYSAEDGPIAALVACVRFSRAFFVSSAITLDYRVLFARHREFKSEQYKAERSLVHTRSALRLLNLCKTQGAIYVKIGQHVASMSHALPSEYTSVLSQLEDRAAYRPYSQVEQVITSELGGKVDDHFSDFEKKPVAAASLAQVHRAKLGNTDERVAVKVQYPGLQTLVAGDLACYRVLSYLLSYAFPDFSLDWIISEFKENLANEVDFRHEANSSERTRLFFAKDRRISVPRIFPDRSTSKVLTMEFIDGIRVDDVDKLQKYGVKPAEVAQAVVDAFGRMVFVSGFVHCDGHSGNMLVRPRRENPGDFELFLLDHGLYAELEEDFRRAYCRLWRGLVLRNESDVNLACEQLGAPGFANLFSIFLLNRNWNSAKQFGVDLRNKMTKEEIQALVKELRDGGLENGADFTAYLRDVPKDLLLVFKMNSLVRNINKKLGAQIDRFKANARFAVRGMRHRNFPVDATGQPFSTMPSTARKIHEEENRGIRSRVLDWIRWEVFNPILTLTDCLAIEINLAVLDFLLVLVRWWRGSSGVVSARDSLG